jgi:hypothetical protein
MLKYWNEKQRQVSKEISLLLYMNKTLKMKDDKAFLGMYNENLFTLWLKGTSREFVKTEGC